MFAQKDQGILSRGKGWEHSKAVAESGSCDCRNYSPSEGLHQFKDVVIGTRVTAITDGLNLKYISHFILSVYVHIVGYSKWVTYSYRSASILYELNTISEG